MLSSCLLEGRSHQELIPRPAQLICAEAYDHMQLLNRLTFAACLLLFPFLLVSVSALSSFFFPFLFPFSWVTVSLLFLFLSLLVCHCVRLLSLLPCFVSGLSPPFLLVSLLAPLLSVIASALSPFFFSVSVSVLFPFCFRWFPFLLVVVSLSLCVCMVGLVDCPRKRSFESGGRRFGGAKVLERRQPIPEGRSHGWSGGAYAEAFFRS